MGPPRPGWTPTLPCPTPRMQTGRSRASARTPAQGAVRSVLRRYRPIGALGRAGRRGEPGRRRAGDDVAAPLDAGEVVAARGATLDRCESDQAPDVPGRERLEHDRARHDLREVLAGRDVVATERA